VSGGVGPIFEGERNSGCQHEFAGLSRDLHRQRSHAPGCALGSRHAGAPARLVRVTVRVGTFTRQVGSTTVPARRWFPPGSWTAETKKD